MFTVEKLCASYAEKKVFENISFSLKENSITALCGLNGIGKSTLLSMMSGIVDSSINFSGKIFADGKNVLEQNPKSNAKQISFLTQNEYSAWNLSVEDIIESGRFVHRKWFDDSNQSDKKIIHNAINLLSLNDLKNRSVSTLSGGEFQRTRLARCIVQETKYIFLDEPFAPVDVTYQNYFIEILKKLCQQGKTICVSIHDINLASQFADQMILLNKNRKEIFQGDTQFVINEKNLEETYGKKFQIFNHPITGKKQIW